MTTAVTAPAEPPAQDERRPRGLPWWANPRIGLVGVIAVLFLVFSLLRPSFLNVDLTIVPMQADLSVFVVVGLAQLSVLSLGHMNLAVPRMAAVSSFAAGLVYDRTGAPLLVGLLVALIAGAVVGGIAGLIITTTGVNSFVVTLALDFGLLGLVSLLYSWFANGVSFAAHPAGMDTLRYDTMADYCLTDSLCGPAIPLVVPFALVAVIVVGILFRLSRVGREILMTGANLQAARLSGIPTNRRIVQAHALSGLLAGLAGWLLAMNNGAFSADIGSQFLLPSFLGPVLGGTLLAGGAVSVIGTVLGAALNTIIQRGLNLLQFPIDQLNVLIGAVLLAALTLDRVRAVMAEKRGVRG